MGNLTRLTQHIFAATNGANCGTFANAGTGSDDDDDVVCEDHANTTEGMWADVRNFLRMCKCVLHIACGLPYPRFLQAFAKNLPHLKGDVND